MFTYVKNHTQCMIILTNIDCICTNNLSKILNQYTFAPRSPEVWKKNPTEWLSSIDIANVIYLISAQFSQIE